MGLKFLLNLAIIAIFTTCKQYEELAETEVVGVTVLKEQIDKSMLGIRGGTEYYFVFAHHAKFSKTDQSLQLGFLEEFTMFQFRVETNKIQIDGGIITTNDQIVLKLLQKFTDTDSGKPKPTNMKIYPRSGISPLVATQKDDEGKVELLGLMEKQFVKDAIDAEKNMRLAIYNKYIRIESEKVLLHDKPKDTFSGFRYKMGTGFLPTGEGDDAKNSLLITSLTMETVGQDTGKSMSLFHRNDFIKITNGNWQKEEANQVPSVLAADSHEDKIKNLLLEWNQCEKASDMGKDIIRPDARMMFDPFYNNFASINSNHSSAAAGKMMNPIEMLKSNTKLEDEFNYIVKSEGKSDMNTEFKLSFKNGFINVPKTNVYLFIDAPEPGETTESKSLTLEEESKSKEQASIEASIRQKKDEESRSLEASIQEASRSKSISESISKSIVDASSSSNSSSSSSSSKKKGGGGAIIAIIVVLLICLVGVVGFAFWKSKQLSGKARRNHNRKI